MSRNDESPAVKRMSNSLACCYKILQMVGELHSRGYQRLRVFPYGRGMYWRIVLAPADLFSTEDCACMESLPEYDRLGWVVRASTGDGCHPFGWRRSISKMPVSRMADLFLESFHAIVIKSQGRDWSYAGWYQEMLMRTSPNVFPMAFSSDEYEEVVCDPLMLIALGKGESSKMPVPPCFQADR